VKILHIRLLSSAETASSAIGVLEERTRGMSIAEIWDKYGYQIIAAILVLALGYFIAKAAGRFVKKYFAKKDAATGFTKFTVGIIKFVVYFSALLFAASIMDIPVTSVLALFSALALAFSLAVKDTLALFASGVMIVLSKPFAVGDFIEIPSENVTRLRRGGGLCPHSSANRRLQGGNYSEQHYRKQHRAQLQQNEGSPP